MSTRHNVHATGLVLDGIGLILRGPSGAGKGTIGARLREADPARRLVFAGDPQRGIPPCSACHGPGGFKLGAPALQDQHAAYIERQLAAFAQGIRQNDIFEQMRAIAKQLTAAEMPKATSTHCSRRVAL